MGPYRGKLNGRPPLALALWGGMASCPPIGNRRIRALGPSSPPIITKTPPPDPNNNKFQGRQVYETISGTPKTVTVVGQQVTGTDTCFLDASADDGAIIPFNQLTNGVTSSWNVGFPGASDGNFFGYDSVGYTLSEVVWIRAHTDVVPCTTTLTQTMSAEVDLPGYSDSQYVTHTLTITIGDSTVQISKDGVSQTLHN